MPPPDNDPLPCASHASSIEGLQVSLETMRKTFVSEVGLSPDPLSAEHPNGTGLKGLLCQVLSKLDALDKRVDELTKATPSTPPGAPSESMIKRFSYYLLLIYLAAQQVPALYQAMKPSPASASPSAQVLPK